MSSFISSLTSRKKSPEKLVRLAMQALGTLAAEESAMAAQGLTLSSSTVAAAEAATGVPTTPRRSSNSDPPSPRPSRFDAEAAAQARRVEEANAQLCKRLAQMKAILYGSEDKLEIDEHKAEELSVCIQTVYSSLSKKRFDFKGDLSHCFFIYLLTGGLAIGSRASAELNTLRGMHSNVMIDSSLSYHRIIS
jgi:hypothetical protein